MPTSEWDSLLNPDDERREHFQREEELEEEMERAKARIRALEDRIRREAKAIRESEEYREADIEYQRAQAALLNHTTYHPSYHALIRQHREQQEQARRERERRRAEAQSRTPSRRRSRQQSPRSSILPSITGTPQNVAPPTSPVGLPSPPAVNRSNFARLQHSPGSRFSPIGTPPRSGRRNGNRHTRSSENRENRARLAREGSGSNIPSTPTRRLRFGTETYQPKLKF